MSPENGVNGDGVGGQSVMDEERMWDLLARHWSGQLSQHEMIVLRGWVAEDPAHGRRMRNVMHTMDAARDLRAEDQASEAWERVQRQIRDLEQSRSSARPLFRGMRSASHSLEKRRVWRRLPIATAAAAVVLVAGIGGFAYYRNGGAAARDVTREYATGRGERTAVDLPDGSRVTLGPQSTLRVVLSRARRERTLHLTGAAHVAVAHDSSWPFTVLAEGVSVRAVGTMFAVRAYPADSMVQVVVADGQVRLRAGHEGAAADTLLDAGDLGEVNGAGTLAVRLDIDVERYLSWMRGSVRYYLTPVSAVVRDLERWYDLAIAVDDPVMQNVRITMTFDPARSPDYAMQRLAELLNARYERSGRSVRLVRERSTAATLPGITHRVGERE